MINLFGLTHVAAIKEITVKLYIDGVPQGSTSYLQSNINDVSESISIGGNYPSGGPNPDFYNGYIDDVHIYDRALSIEEVEQLYTVPEPATLLLLGLGGLLIRKRK